MTFLPHVSFFLSFFLSLPTARKKCHLFFYLSFHFPFPSACMPLLILRGCLHLSSSRLFSIHNFPKGSQCLLSMWISEVFFFLHTTTSFLSVCPLAGFIIENIRGLMDDSWMFDGEGEGDGEGGTSSRIPGPVQSTRTPK